MKSSPAKTLSSWFEVELSRVLKFDGTKEISEYAALTPKIKFLILKEIIASKYNAQYKGISGL